MKKLYLYEKSTMSLLDYDFYTTEEIMLLENNGFLLLESTNN